MFNHVMLSVDFGGGEVMTVKAIQLDVEAKDKVTARKPWTRGSRPDTKSWKNYRKAQHH